MFKRLILCFLLLCSVVSVRAGEYSGDLSNIQSQLYEIWETLDFMWGEVSDIKQLIKDPGSYNWYYNITTKLLSFDAHLESIDSIVNDLYPDLLQQYYHVITIDENTANIDRNLTDATDYLLTVRNVIMGLQSTIESYESFYASFTGLLTDINYNNSDIASYVRAIYEDVDTIKALFLGESNLREMLETLMDISSQVESFQARFQMFSDQVYEYFLYPFDNSGFSQAYSQTWEYFDRTFDPLWTWSNGSRSIDVLPSNWGALDDICSGLLAILQGNEVMNYNLAYLCQGVTVIASNLMNGVNMDAKYREFQNEFQERSVQLMQQFGSLSDYEDGFSSVDSSQVTAIFDSQVQNFQNTFSRYSVRQLDDEAVITLNGLGGFFSSVSSVSGSLDLGSYSAFFVAARAVFGFLYWIIEFGFILWLIGKCLNLYKFTLRMFCTLPRQVSN